MRGKGRFIEASRLGFGDLVDPSSHSSYQRRGARTHSERYEQDLQHRRLMAVISFLFNWFVKLTGWLPQLIFFRIRVTYEDKAKQSKRLKGRAILVSNHNTLMDFAILLFVFWRRTLRCAVAEVMYRKNFLMSLLLKLLGCVKVDRDSHDFGFLNRLKHVLDRGGVVEIYPEARLPQKGETALLEFKPSYVYLALETSAPIVPIYQNGNAFGKGRAEVVIGTPIDVAALYDATLSEKENIQKINEYVRSKIIELGKTLEKQEEMAPVC